MSMPMKFYKRRSFTGAMITFKMIKTNIEYEQKVILFLF